MTIQKPVVTEKATKLADKRNVYSFMVDMGSNKIEIRKAVEAMFNVTVKAVNTSIIPAKKKQRSTKRNILRGASPSYKKAYVTLAEGETIDIYGGADEE